MQSYATIGAEILEINWKSQASNLTLLASQKPTGIVLNFYALCTLHSRYLMQMTLCFFPRYGHNQT